MDLTLRHALTQELGEVSEFARYYEEHGRDDIAQEYRRQVSNLKVVIARTQLIDGLRALADFLENEPDVPVNSWATISYSVSAKDLDTDDRDQDDAERAEVDRVAAILGVTPTENDSSSHYTAMRAFGPVEYRATAITQEHMAVHAASETYYGVVTP